MLNKFWSHSPHDKAHVRAIRSYLPQYISAWIDEYELILDSADINAPITNAIQEEAEFVILFLGREAKKSKWVRREYEWALKKEKFHANNA